MAFELLFVVCCWHAQKMLARTEEGSLMIVGLLMVALAMYTVLSINTACMSDLFTQLFTPPLSHSLPSPPLLSCLPLPLLPLFLSSLSLSSLSLSSLSFSPPSPSPPSPSPPSLSLLCYPLAFSLSRLGDFGLCLLTLSSISSGSTAL